MRFGIDGRPSSWLISLSVYVAPSLTATLARLQPPLATQVRFTIMVRFWGALRSMVIAAQALDLRSAQRPNHQTVDL